MKRSAHTHTPAVQYPSPAISQPDSSLSRERGLARLRKVVHMMDTAYRIPGTRVTLGWDGLIGLVPGIGDVATGLIAGYVLAEAARLGASRWTLTRMAANIVVDVLVGAVPVVGDLFDVAWKANVRNLRLLNADLGRR